MNKDKLLELINKEVDGTISRREKKNLLGYLDDHPDASTMYHEIKDAVEILDSVEELEPSPRIVQNVMTRIDPSKYQPKPKESFKWNFDLIFGHKYRLAYSFLGGILIGVILLGLFKLPPQPDTHAVSGTIGSAIKTVAAFPVTADQANGHINVTRLNNQFRLEIILNSNEIYEIAIRYNKQNLEFVSLTPIEPQKTVIEQVHDQLRLSGFKDAHSVILFDKISDETDYIDVMLVVSQETVLNKKIILE
jgi:hypothetical protein